MSGFRNDPESALPYREWRKKLDHGAVCDLDQVEYREVRPGLWRPIALIELSQLPEDDRSKDGWLHTFSGYYVTRDPERIRKRSATAVARYVASVLGVPLYLVAFPKQMDEDFCTQPVYQYSCFGKRWMEMTREQYELWLKSLYFDPKGEP